jgi:hypothetical protein
VVVLILLGVVLDTPVVLSLVVVLPVVLELMLVLLVDLHLMNHQAIRHQAPVVLLAVLKLVYINCVKFHCLF